MELINILNIVKKWIWLIVIIIGTTLAVQFILISRSSGQYESTAIIQVLTPDREDVSITDAYLFTSDRDEITVVINNFLKVSNHREIYEMTNLQLDNAVEYEVSTRAELGADLLYVTASSGSPNSAADVANAFAQNAIAYYGSLRSQAAQQSFEHFTLELEIAAEELADARQEIINFQTKNGLASPASEIQLIQGSLQRLNEAKDEQSIDTILANQTVNDNDALDANQLASLQIEIQEANLEILKLENEILSVESNEEDQSSSRLAELEEEIKLYQLKITLLEEQQAQITALSEQNSLTTSREASEIDRLIEEQKARLVGMIQLEIEYDSLVEEVNQIEEKINFLNQKANESNLMQAFAKQATFLQLIELAEPPLETNSNHFVLLMLGFLGSLGFSLFFVFILDFLTKFWKGKNKVTLEPELTIEN